MLSIRNCEKAARTLLFVFASLQSPIASAQTTERLGQYEISFAPRRLAGEKVPEDVAPKSEIRVTRVRSGGRDEILKESSSLDAGCGGVPAMGSIGDRYVVLCGHLGGRHYTYRVFRIGASGLESATLDTFDQAAPFEVDAKGRLTTLVTRRDQFPRELVGPFYFPVVYALHADESSFGFLPDFGETARPQYMKFYAWVRENKAVSQFLPVMLAALTAAQDRGATCREIKEWRSAELRKQGSADGFDSAIREWSRKLPSIGYPRFDSDTCQGE